VKHRFGLYQFGQSTLLGLIGGYYYLYIAYILAFWAYLGVGKTTLPDGISAGLVAREKFGDHWWF